VSRTRGAGTPGQLPAGLWPAVIIGASVIGGLAATALGGASILSALIVAILVGAAIALATRLWLRGPAQHSAPDHPSRSRPGTDEKHGPDGAVQMMKLPAPAAPGRSWWEKTGPAPRSTRKARPAPALSSYLSSAVIAQCPLCGSFAINADERPAEWAFGCRLCGHGWAWRPGAPWPAIEVRPALRDGRYRPPLSPGSQTKRSGSPGRADNGGD
jgi:hypothetical protein